MSYTLDELVSWLRAAGEPTRLRILAILSRGEMTVSELTQVLGHSQPRISRHLKLLVDAGLLERKPEGSWVFYRLARDLSSASLPTGGQQDLARLIAGLVPADSSDLTRDLERLETVRQARSARALSYFQDNADHWDEIRLLQAPDAEVEAAILELAGPGPHQLCLDLGTGTGRMLQLLAPLVRRGEGIDTSHSMLTIARNNLDRPQYSHCQVRLGDMFALPFASAATRAKVNGPEIDLIIVHQVLHYLADPQAALSEAARVLSPGGRLLVVDFAPHDIESLRDTHAHRRLGFSDAEMRDLLKGAGLSVDTVRHLRPLNSSLEHTLTVSIWRSFAPSVALSKQSMESAVC